MALRAGYYGVKRFLCNKLETIAGTYDETIKNLFPRSEQAVLGAKNIIPYPYHSPNSYTSHDVGFTVNTNKTVTTDSGTASGADAVFTLLQKSDAAFNDFFELTKGKTIKLTGVPEGASTSTYWLMIYDTSAHNLVSGEMEYQMPETMPSAFYLQIVVKNGQSASNKIWKPMISFDGGEYVPPAMTNKELTDSAADQKTAINAIITAATGAADFAAFKTAMGAITPVTRSLSLTKENIIEEVKEDVEPEKTVTKKRTTKKTKEV